MKAKITVLGGDGIGPEVTREGVRALQRVAQLFGHEFAMDERDFGGIAIDKHGDPLPADTLASCLASDAILLGAIGGPKWSAPDAKLRPETGLLRLRRELGVYANLRPVAVHPALADSTTLKAEVVRGVDLVFVRELTGGIYFGEPRGIRTLENGERQGFNTDIYSESEIRRIGRVAFEAARKRGRRLCSVDEANVLEVTVLWREVMTELAAEYPDVELSHMYVDNAAMQLVRAPKQFDVVVTGNLFGDILSDAAAMLTGSIGMLPSASLDVNGKGMS